MIAVGGIVFLIGRADAEWLQLARSSVEERRDLSGNRFESTTVDLGALPPESNSDFELRLRNSSAVWFEIDSIVSACSCTTATVTGSTIEPGNEISLPIVIKTRSDKIPTSVVLSVTGTRGASLVRHNIVLQYRTGGVGGGFSEARIETRESDMRTLTLAVAFLIFTDPSESSANPFTDLLDRRDRLPALKIQLTSTMIVDELSSEETPSKIGSVFSVRQKSDGRNFWRWANWNGFDADGAEVYLESADWAVRGSAGGDSDYVEIKIEEQDDLWGSGPKDLHVFGVLKHSPRTYTRWDYAMVRSFFESLTPVNGESGADWESGPYKCRVEEGELTRLQHSNGREKTEAIFSEFVDVGKEVKYSTKIDHKIYIGGRIVRHSVTAVDSIEAEQSHSADEYDLDSLGLGDGTIVGSPRGIGVIRDSNFVLTHTPVAKEYEPPAIERESSFAGRQPSSIFSTIAAVLVSGGVVLLSTIAYQNWQWKRT